MKRLLTTFATGALALGVIAAPAGAASENANGGVSAGAKACAAQKKADKAAFVALYGDHAMRECIRQARAADDDLTPGELKNAAKECRAERDLDSAAFAETYGTNGNKRNAFGKCVSSKVKKVSDVS